MSPVCAAGGTQKSVSARNLGSGTASTPLRSPTAQDEHSTRDVPKAS